MSFNKLSAFALASFEMNAANGGTHAYADAVHDLTDQISLSPQAMGAIGVHMAPAYDLTHPEDGVELSEKSQLL